MYNQQQGFGSQITQPGFAGTDTQQVRQQNQQSQYGQQQVQPQPYFSGQPQQQGFGPQQALQPGFAGTDAQEVRRQNEQSMQNHQGMMGQPQQVQPQFAQQPQFQQTIGQGSHLQPGFAGTNPQEVQRQNAQSTQGLQGQQQFQPVQQQYQPAQQSFGPQQAFHPNFAGTNAQQVRQQNAQSQGQPYFTQR